MDGTTVVIIPAGWYVKEIFDDTVAPVSAVITTSPLVSTPPGPARSMAQEELDWTTVAFTPAIVTEVMKLPYPMRLDPLSMTNVPYLPCVGLTLVMFPGTCSMNNPPLTIAPVLDSM